MAKSKLSDAERLVVVRQEIEQFRKLMQGHEKLLEAIGRL